MSQQGQPTILLIEADPSLRRLIVLGLSHSGMRVIETSLVQELSALDAQTLDLLIVDVDQGVKSDWSLLSTLREQADLATLPIVALSWESPAEDKVSPPTSLFSSIPFLPPPRRGSALCLPNSLPTEDLICLSKPFYSRALHSAIA